MTKKEREAHFISYINPNNSPFDNLPEYITKCSNCGCGLSNVAFYCPICGVKINERVVHSRDNSIIIYPSWILDKIREEIENHCGLAKENHCRYCSYCTNLMGVREILETIDKYKAESEDKE